MVLKRAIPVMISYFFISMAFGVVASKLFDFYSILMSVTVFAGAAQFIAVRMAQENFSIASIILAVLLVNSRHILMCSYISPLHPDLSRFKKAVMAFGITDETFALGISEKSSGSAYQMRLNFLSFTAWVSGTAFGILFGEIIPENFYHVLPFGLTAMFISILVSNARGYSHVIAAIIAGLLSIAIGGGMAVIVSSLAGIIAGSVVERWTGE